MIKYFKYIFNNKNENKHIFIFGVWGLGIGDWAVEVVIVGLTGLVEHALDTYTVEVGRTMPVTKPADVRLHQSYGNLVTVDDLASSR